MTKLISEITGVAAPKPYNNSKATALTAADPQLLYGLELEIEGIPDWDEMTVPGMNSVEDGSLRNHGREFLTSPATFSITAWILNSFFKKNNLNDHTRHYSERTSIHVHANCLDLTIEQLATVLLLYQAYEKLFYAFVGKERDKNVFCVPWSETRLTENIIPKLLGNLLAYAIPGWQKYTGLNIIPLTKLGTIEFRHMGGTNDVEHILNWMNLIGSLFATARKYELKEIKEKILTLNTSSQYRNITELVFGNWAASILNQPQFLQHIEEGVINTKYCLVNEKLIIKDKPSLYAELMNQRAAELALGEEEPAPRAPLPQNPLQPPEQARGFANIDNGIRRHAVWPAARVEENYMQRIEIDFQQEIQAAADRLRAADRAAIRPMPLPPNHRRRNNQGNR